MSKEKEMFDQLMYELEQRIDVAQNTAYRNAVMYAQTDNNLYKDNYKMYTTIAGQLQSVMDFGTNLKDGNI